MAAYSRQVGGCCFQLVHIVFALISITLFKLTIENKWLIKARHDLGIRSSHVCRPSGAVGDDVCVRRRWVAFVYISHQYMHVTVRLNYD